jgi:hypothetical protein
MAKLPAGTPVMYITNATGPFKPAPADLGTLQDWLNLSYKLMPIDKWLTPAIQRLGFLDLSLRAQDNRDGSRCRASDG